MTISEDEKINNPMINSWDTKDLSLLLSKYTNPVIKELLNKQNLRDKSGLNNGYGLGKNNYNEQQRLDDIIIKQGMDILAQQA